MTEAAARHFQSMLAENPKALGIRIKVKDSGCSGYAYSIDFALDEQVDDEILAQPECKLYVDKRSLSRMRGTKLDYVQEGVNWLLKFRNPLAVDECGCGESFKVKEQTDDGADN